MERAGLRQESGELSDRAAAGPAGAAGAQKEMTAGENLRTQNLPAPAAAPPAPTGPAGPGEQTAYGIRVCNMNDGMAEGAVVDGYRKVVYTSPFGKSCGWERAR